MTKISKTLSAATLSFALIGLGQIAGAKELATVKSVEGFTWETQGTCTSHCKDSADAKAGDARGFTWETAGECTNNCSGGDQSPKKITGATLK